MILMTKYLLFIIAMLICLFSFGQLRVDTSKSPDYLVKEVLLKGDASVEVRNIRLRGIKRAFGAFKNEGNRLEIDYGIIMATGSADWASGPNESPYTGDNISTGGDFYLSSIAGQHTYDATVIEFDFIPSYQFISFNFVFGSEEYIEYVGSEFNDVFGFFLSGAGIRGEKNIATLPDGVTPITVNNVNHLKNSEYYVDNNHWDMEGNVIPGREQQIPNELEYDGYTTLLLAQSDVVPGQTYHIKIAIADVSDDKLDSGVFLESSSFKSHETKIIADKSHPFLTDEVKYFTTVVVHVNFDVDSDKIKEESYKDINKIYMQMLDPNTILEIHGHTDNTGTDEYNMTLSLNRAKSVAKYLIDKGIPEKRIVSVEGFGRTKPVSTNQTELGRYENRRVEFIIKTLKEK